MGTGKEWEAAKKRIMREAQQQRLPCSKAFAIAAETGLSIPEVGRLCNELQVKIVGCQLGCF